MGVNASAYAALGLEPDASREAIEVAYKRLIKQHHPDRAGGNSEHAAEITRAYRELRAASAEARGTLEFNIHPSAARTHPGWLMLLVVTAVGVFALAFLAGPFAPQIFKGGPLAGIHEQLKPQNGKARDRDAMTATLNLDVIDRSIDDAAEMWRTSDEMKLAETSRACHQRFRANPGIEQFDRCSAFDDTIVLLQDRDPMRDRGPFSQLEVTGRQWSDASALSNEYLAIDGRLDQIRLRAELALAAPQEKTYAAQTGGIN